MEIFKSAIDVLQTLVTSIGAGLAVWGAINLLEGYGNDNPGAKSQGITQLMPYGGIVLVGMVLVPLLSRLFGSLMTWHGHHHLLQLTRSSTNLIPNRRLFRPNQDHATKKMD